MTREQWTALAARCEAATGPSDELDAHILCGLAPEGAYVEQSRINGAWCIYHGAEYRSGRPALWVKPFRVGGWPVTASLDAITALIERELPKHLLTLVIDPGVKACARLQGDGFDVTGYAATEALARAAALCFAMAERAAT